MFMTNFTDSPFMTADEKRRVLRAWTRFFKHELPYRHFTKALYKHLTLHCGHIAHYDRLTYHRFYFEDGEELGRFLDQFDRSSGCRGAETGSTFWLTGTHADINNAMVDAVKGMIPALRDRARKMIEQTARAAIEAATRKLAEQWSVA
jgi:hypothetical protein